MAKQLLFFIIILAFSYPSFAQRKNKKAKQEAAIVIKENIIPSLQQHIKILSSDSLEGRRTGTKGEQLAASYIKNQFSNYGIDAKGTNGGYFQTFEVNEGMQYEEKSNFYLNNNKLKPNTEFFPLNQSANGEINEIVSPILKDHNTTWFLDLKEDLIKNQKNPHYDVSIYLNEKIKDYINTGAKSIIICNTSKLPDNLGFDAKVKIEKVAVPLVYISKEVMTKYFKDPNTAAEIKYNIEIKEKKRTGTNVISYINNKAENTIIIGAHFDHLGYGEDKNSLYAGATKMVHNGADDNASGTAALIELSKILKESKLKNNNYLFIAFSGEELGLYGSKFFTENPTIDLSKVDYMINMDMIGRLNDSTKAFTIGGYGTSPTWGELIKQETNNDGITVKIDSSGTGPSDHTSFYRKNIPVLFFFTGTHSDYHKPSDDYEKINSGGEEKIVNYIVNLISNTNSKPKLEFTKTRESALGGSSTRFTVSLGIMPDYTFSGTGVRADGISEGKLAQRIGLQAGDIVIKLGDNNITSVENYMKVLSKFKKGDSTKLVTIRAGKEIIYDITF